MTWPRLRARVRTGRGTTVGLGQGPANRPRRAGQTDAASADPEAAAELRGEGITGENLADEARTDENPEADLARDEIGQ